MYKVIILLLLVMLQSSCDSNDENCEDIYYITDASPAIYIIPKYIYATEETNDACYAHGLDMIDRWSNPSPLPMPSDDQCLKTPMYDYPAYNNYRMDTIQSKFTNNLENLNASEVEQLTNLICGREFGNDNFEIQSLDEFSITDGELIVEYTINDITQTKIIRSYQDSRFNCPLYSFSCKEPQVRKQQQN